MDSQNEKCVMIFDETIPLGLIANTAAIMGVTLGKAIPEIVGPDVTDKTGREHLGIIQFPVPILKATSARLKELREKLYQNEFSDLVVADFSDLAQHCKTYEEFTNTMRITDESGFRYLGLALCGPRKKVNKLTGNMPLLR